MASDPAQHVAQLSEGMVLKPALAFKKIVKTKTYPVITMVTVALFW